MKTYEIIYYDEFCGTDKETDTYAVYEVNETKTKNRLYLQAINGKQEKFKDLEEDWFNYIVNKHAKVLSEEALFTLLL